MSSSLDQRVSDWLGRDPDPETRAELEQLVTSGNTEEIERRFYGRLQFGTAGIRGVLGAGPTRMNRLVVRETTAGLGAYLLQEVPGAVDRGVVVGYDGRRKSRVFAEDAAGVLAGMGLRVFLTRREQPTPIGSFAVKDLGAAGGIVITASHNPPEYNGCKVYWQNGAQIVPPHDTGIAVRVEEAKDRPLPWMDPEEAKKKSLIVSLRGDLVERYLDGLEGLSIHRPDPLRAEMVIAYTPLHGVAAPVAEKALKRAGFTRVFTVESQREPDANFPTVRFPNPEEPGAMDAVLALAKDKSAELAFANDPDGDRLAVAVRTPTGNYCMLTGDQLGVLLGAEILDSASDPVTVATTVVSSRMLGVMARVKGADYVETLTGFKWIVNQGLAREKEGYRFAFGYEEALGYCVGTLVPDKDGISAMVAFAELAAHCRQEGMSVLDRLEHLYRSYGLFVTAQRSLAFDPDRNRDVEGSSLCAKLRTTPPAVIAGRAVRFRLDVSDGKRVGSDGQVEPSHLPTGDVLVYELEGDARVIVRPSGTEPKLKCYYEVRETIGPDETFANAEARAASALEDLIAKHQSELLTLATR
jgi:phosphomannomutase